MKNKPYQIVLFLFIFSLTGVMISEKKFFSNFSSVFSFNKSALAEDEEDDDEEDEDDDDDDDDEENNDSSSSSTPKTYQQVIKLPDQIITKTIIEDVVLPDSDKDGLADVDDPHPTIPEYIIVNDVNGNGIDDNFEIEKTDNDGNGVVDSFGTAN